MATCDSDLYSCGIGETFIPPRDAHQTCSLDIWLCDMPVTAAPTSVLASSPTTGAQMLASSEEERSGGTSSAGTQRNLINSALIGVISKRDDHPSQETPDFAPICLITGNEKVPDVWW